jgi:phosphoenolpyruvate-protein kinase (PTS system EI component)
MAGEPAGALRLVGLGVDELSTGPGRFGAVKRAMRAASREELEQLARTALTLRSAAEVRERVAPLLARAARSEAAA